MAFTLSEPYFSSPWESLFWLWLLSALIIGILLFLWRRRSEHEARDVLHAAPALPVSDSKRLLDFTFWALPAAALLLALIIQIEMLYDFLFLDPVALMRIPGEHGTSVGPSLDLLPREVVLVSLVVCAGLVLRRQLRGSQRDVLSLSTRT